MNFKDLKQNYPVYILDKQDVRLITGKVTQVSFPRLDNSIMTQGPKMVVDITIEADNKSATYTIPEDLHVTYAGNLVLSTDKDGLIKEVESMKAAAEQVLSTVDHQKDVLAKASTLLADLNPVFKEKKENEQRFTKIEDSISKIKDMIEALSNNLNKQ